MNKILVSLSSLCLIGFVACSSMKVEESETRGLPSDFTVADYAKLNPDLVRYQYVDYVLRANQPFLDSLMFNLGDSLTRVAMKAHMTADTTEYAADLVFAEQVLTTYAGYDRVALPATMDSLDANQRRVYRRYNQIRLTLAEDKAFLAAFQIDSSLLEVHYEILGQAAGRPYKYCAPGEIGELQNRNTQASGDSLGLPDYRPNTYCLNEADSEVYLIK